MSVHEGRAQGEQAQGEGAGCRSGGGGYGMHRPCALALVVLEKRKYQTHLLEEKLIRCEACSG